MPTCRDMSELVTDYLEQALPVRARAGVRWHLLLCPACRTYFAQMRGTVRLLARLPPRPPAASLTRLLGRLPQGQADDPA